ncbi:unnamed protein product [Clonostachys solani]|uniref:Nuclear protein Es2 n=1 Tax=Clonostachys solani TaxID=160281 RepID=A0A9P0EN13_9HYPO|nr:unnamed protein product [Clonostachys solani]
MEKQASQSSALVHKRSADMALMPPPPQVKKVKRPKKILDEDSYTEALSQIIARDFFPGLLETETKQEYLDALESKDPAWISSAGRRLHQVMTPGRAKHAAPSSTRRFDGGQTPTTYVGDTPGSVASTTVADSRLKIDTNISLTKFQETYTSEDNESFYKLVDKHNQKRADKYAWLWRENKLPSRQMIKQREVEDKLSQTRSLTDDGFKKDRLAIKDSDDRPARPDSWNAAPKNTLMFTVDGVDDGAETVAQKAATASRAPPRTIVYSNTRMPDPHVPNRPPSPTASSIRAAVAGRPRQHDQDSGFDGGETPRVNGYAFVDDEDDEEPTDEQPPVINLGPGDSNNPFKLQEQRERETLHERMVERIAKSNKAASQHGFMGKVDNTPVPRFPSSPRVSGSLTPAAQRLWSKIGSSKAQFSGSRFAQSTPMKQKGSLLRSVKRATPKHE